MLVTREQIDSLLSYNPNGSPLVSFYLNTDRGQKKIHRIESAGRHRLHEAIEALRDNGAEGELLDAARKEAKRIEDYLENHLSEHFEPGMVVFCGQDGGIFEVFDMPRPVPTRVIINSSPYLQPLLAVLSEYERYAVVLLDMQKARLIEVYMGQAEERAEIFDDVPSKVKAGGWNGLLERRMQRRTETKMHEHFKHVAAELFKLYQKKQLDRLLVGCSQEYYQEFIRCLHPFLQERLAGRFSGGPEDDIKPVFKKVKEIKEDVRRKEDQSLLEDTLVKPEQPDMVSKGLGPVARSVAMGEAGVLLVKEGSSRPGRICPDCGWVDDKAESCQLCDTATEKREDIIEELVEAAARHNCRIRFVEPTPELEQAEGVAAQLRFRAMPS
jgi:peptide subunit release factor 1 (eRF1)